MHLVIATREDPQLPLSRYRAQGQCTELRTADLRFTPAEAGEPDLPPFYEIGNRQTLAGFVAHCIAIQEMKAFQ